MPFVSRAQQRWGHTAAGEKALGGASAVAEWDSVTPKGKAVPQRVGKINKMRKRGVVLIRRTIGTCPNMAQMKSMRPAVSGTWFAWRPVRTGALGTGRFAWLRLAYLVLHCNKALSIRMKITSIGQSHRILSSALPSKVASHRMQYFEKMAMTFKDSSLMEAFKR